MKLRLFHCSIDLKLITHFSLLHFSYHSNYTEKKKYFLCTIISAQKLFINYYKINYYDFKVKICN